MGPSSAAFFAGRPRLLMVGGAGTGIDRSVDARDWCRGQHTDCVLMLRNLLPWTASTFLDCRHLGLTLSVNTRDEARRSNIQLSSSGSAIFFLGRPRAFFTGKTGGDLLACLEKDPEVQPTAIMNISRNAPSPDW